AEDGVAAVHAGRLGEADVELAGGGIHGRAADSADRALFMAERWRDFRLEPVADAAEAKFAGAQGAAPLEVGQGLPRGLLVERAMERQAVVITRLRQGDEVADMVGRGIGVKLDR